MKEKIQIKNLKGEVVFKGKPINMPYKAEYIKEKCIELFNDDDPCIIHQSYAVNHFVEHFLDFYRDQHVQNHPLADDAKHFGYLDIPHLETLFLTIEGKK